ncbi:DEAD/DEAH box helicase [Pyrobaculum calidifontis]|uniref:ATP-dependent DNA helicase Hel308 n=1 Tax=Pyrobaculum calidifontis (strain DSM 21063 / JCM 11548 / VA1) TaxID=410359 RepID=HELS_PYRCJ|nr:DEAD/DEAH box helicase [Pyrobaculum calidifontis]A3MSA1.1 RecName: Full=ATP-dependent DNA helicase Hel308; AltName: Full=DNA 3'-5' helicase Hel308 [Pyrobaculum calidifontis JCM 11548]ABO07518.1 DEAD/DEAH box helicase domain protein [Pyrobaculum calidifontis JCM 11548]
MEVSELPLDARLIAVLKERGVGRLFPPQVEAVRAGIFDGRSVLLCTATASGKSLLAEVAAVKAGLEGRMALYAVPLKALAYEKLVHFSYYRGLVKVGVSTGDFDSDDRRLHEFDVVVVTYEKLDSLLRHRPNWLGLVGVVVVDEIHYLGDPRRGPVLESIVAKLRHLGLKTQFIGLSATVGNAGEVAAWLGARLVESSWRPVPLREGVYHGGVIRFSDGSMQRVNAPGDAEVALAVDAVAGGGQALVFTNSRSSTVRLAKAVAKAMEAAGLVPRGAKALAEEVLKASSSKIIGRELADLVARGVAFHNAGLELEVRRLVEDGFRRGLLKVVVSTTTLAAGVNLPARRVVVADYERFDPALGREEIPVLEYRQMAGRAGRPGLDPYGEAVLVARSKGEAEYLMERYVRGQVEGVRSHILAEPNLRAHVLGAVGGGYAKSLDDLVDFFSNTLGAAQMKTSLKLSILRSKIGGVVEELVEWGFLERDGDFVYATELGRQVARLYLDPEVAAGYIRLIKSLRAGNVPAYLYVVLTAPDFPRVRRGRADKRVVEGILAALDVEEDEEFEDLARTASMLMAWIEEVDEDVIYEKFDVAPGDLRVYVDLFQWLGNAAAKLARLVGREEHGKRLEVVTARVVYGVREELLGLVTSLRGVGRVRARTLYNFGYRTLEDIARATVREIASLPGFGEKLAESVIEQARQMLAEGLRGEV